MSALETTKKEAVLFLTHVWSESLARKFISLRQSTINMMDCFVLVDAMDPEVVDSWQSWLDNNGCGDHVLQFDANQIEASLGYDCYVQGKIVPGSAHYPVLNFWKSFKYEHYWVIEFDVCLTGEWSAFFELFEHDQSDLLLSHLTSYDLDPGWSWWSSIRVPFEVLNNIPKGDFKFFYKGFCPIYRITYQALAVIDIAYTEGWRGHFEGTLPTILMHKKLSIKDFNDFGDLYFKGPVGPGDGNPPFSSLRWRPEIQPNELNASVGLKIFHPVKF